MYSRKSLWKIAKRKQQANCSSCVTEDVSFNKQAQTYPNIHQNAQHNSFTMVKFAIAASAILALAQLPSSHGFAPASFAVNTAKQSLPTISSMMPNHMQQASTSLNMIVDPAQIANDATNFLSTLGTDNFLSFSDQGQNLAGIFFQASLLPYLAFLYFLSFRGNRTPELGNFGFQFLLLFVLGTIPSGIVTRGAYGTSLADCDWLHGGAELLLTITNILVLSGFRQAMTVPAGAEEFKSNWKYKAAGAGAVAAFGAALATGPGLGFESHSAFLFGLGDLPTTVTESLPWVSTYSTSTRTV